MKLNNEDPKTVNPEEKKETKKKIEKMLIY